MKVNHNSYIQHSTILDYMDNTQSDDSIESLIKANAEKNFNALREKLGIADDSTKNFSSKVFNSSEAVLKHLDRLNDEGENSLFTKAENAVNSEEKDKAMSDIYTDIQAFVSNYNSIVKNLSNKGDSSSISFLTNLGKLYVDNEEALSNIGITRDSKKGTLTVDTNLLKEAPLQNLRTLFNGNKSYAAKIKNTCESITKYSQTISKIPSNLYSNSYNNNASFKDNSTYLSDALFSSKA